MDRRAGAATAAATPAVTIHPTGDDAEQAMPSAVPVQMTGSLPHGSPFDLKTEDVESLAQSGGFTILRDHLAEHYLYEFVHPSVDDHLFPY